MLDIRAMLPADIEAVTHIQKEAFSGSVGTSVGDNYIKAVIHWFMTYSSSITLVCEKDSRIVGYTYGAPQGYSRTLNHDLLGIILYAVATHPRAIFRPELLHQIPARVNNLLSRHSHDHETAVLPRSIYRLVAIGVASEARKQGIGRALVSAFERTAWEHRADEVQLSVYPNNTAGRALYEACGWRVMSAEPHILQYHKNRPEDNSLPTPLNR